MFTIDAYSGLLKDEEIIQRLRLTLHHFKRKTMTNSGQPPEGIEAYVLLNCELGLENEVVKELISIPEVTEVKGVFGVYDFIVKIFSESEEEIKMAIAKVREISKIKSSLTMMVIESQSNSALGP